MYVYVVLIIYFNFHLNKYFEIYLVMRKVHNGFMFCSQKEEILLSSVTFSYDHTVNEACVKNVSLDIKLNKNVLEEQNYTILYNTKSNGKALTPTMYLFKSENLKVVKLF